MRCAGFRPAVPRFFSFSRAAGPIRLSSWNVFTLMRDVVVGWIDIVFKSEPHFQTRGVVLRLVQTSTAGVPVVKTGQGAVGTFFRAMGSRS